MFTLLSWLKGFNICQLYVYLDMTLGHINNLHIHNDAQVLTKVQACSLKRNLVSANSTVA